jgi:hypothetical protein
MQSRVVKVTHRLKVRCRSRDAYKEEYIFLRLSLLLFNLRAILQHKALNPPTLNPKKP